MAAGAGSLIDLQNPHRLQGPQTIFLQKEHFSSCTASRGSDHPSPEGTQKSMQARKY